MRSFVAVWLVPQIARAELVEAIVYLAQHQASLELDEEVSARLQAFIKEYQHYGKQHIAHITTNALGADDYDRIVPSHYVPIKTMPRIEVVAQQQIAKVAHQQTQEKDIDLKSLAELLRKKHQKIKLYLSSEKLPPVIGLSGDDRHWYNGTYYEVKNLYTIAANKGILRDEDKNHYLPEKFLNHSSKWRAYGDVGSFFIDRMICKTFHKISDKQELTQQSIDKLLSCVTDLSQFKKVIFGTDQDDLIAPKMINEDICRDQYKNEPALIADVARKIRQEGLTNLKVGWFSCSYQYYPNKIMAIINAELEAMRVDAISALYNVAFRNRKSLNQQAISKIEKCLRDSNAAVKAMALKIIGLFSESVAVNYRELFSAYLSQLSKVKSSESSAEKEAIEQAINYFYRQSQNQQKCHELFTAETISTIIRAIEQPGLASQYQLDCLNIINLTLQHDTTAALSEQQLHALIALLQKSHDQTLNKQILYLLTPFSFIFTRTFRFGDKNSENIFEKAQCMSYT